MLCSSIICSQFVLAQAQQTYRIGRLQLTNGTFVKGKKMTVGGSDITMLVHMQQVTYPKSDVVRAEYKRGWAGGWAAGCGLSCFALLAIGNFANSDNPLTPGEIILGSAIWGGLSAAAGGLIGHFTDSYQTAYVKAEMSFLRNFGVQLYGFEKKQLGLTCNVSIPSL
jgi:hypothetical protein